MKEPVLIVVKPDAMVRNLAGDVLSKLSNLDLDIIALNKLTNVTKDLAIAHYSQLKDLPFFEDIVNYLSGVFHNNSRVLAMITFGDNAVEKCRDLAGATNPEEADFRSIRGTYGRISTKGLFENILHVSFAPDEAEREIKLWFAPDEIFVKDLYKTKEVQTNLEKKRIWHD